MRQNSKNRRNAAAALSSVRAYSQQPGHEAITSPGLLEQNICDLLADLAHLCDREAISLPFLLESAASRYAAETEMESSLNFVRRIVRETLAPEPLIAGTREGGVYIPVGLGHGFYIPAADYEAAQARAAIAGKVQFVGLARDGSAVHGTRDELQRDPRVDGYIAWIFPPA